MTPPRSAFEWCRCPARGIAAAVGHDNGACLPRFAIFSATIKAITAPNSTGILRGLVVPTKCWATSPAMGRTTKRAIKTNVQVGIPLRCLRVLTGRS